MSEEITERADNFKVKMATSTKDEIERFIGMLTLEYVIVTLIYYIL